MTAKRMIVEEAYSLELKREFLNKTALVSFNNQLTLKKASFPIEREAFTHMMFDESGTVEGARIAFGLIKNQTALDSADSCSFKIFRVSNDATPWVDTLVKQGTLSIGSDKLFKTTLDVSEAGTDILGDVTFKVQARILRGSELFFVQEYFNHLGLTDKVERLRKRVQFLSITKKDFGV